jgi:O-acetyl-ADP-ribose deacetylase (regulator of RNase III)
MRAGNGRYAPACHGGEPVSSLTYLMGDATAPASRGPAIIAHVCNDVGEWGRGFVLALSRRWTEPEEAYLRWHRERAVNDFGLGAVQLVAVEPDRFVANMVAQRGIVAVAGIPPIRYEALGACLERLTVLAASHAATIHMPRIGCGLAGGKWDHVEPLIVDRLSRAGIRTFVYDLSL